jgi:hypothetical protein
VTVLFPFVPRARLDDRVLERARRVVGRRRAFEFDLARVATFPDVVWLAPEPSARFRGLTEALVAEFPQQPPYGGEFDELIPHATLTVVAKDELAAALERLRPLVEPLLPIPQRASELTLLVEDEPERWREELRLPLGE